jgi:hypothetical protein
MRVKKQRGPGPSSTLITPDHAGNVVGVAQRSAPARGPIVAQTSPERPQQLRALEPKLGPKRVGIAGDSH